MRDVTSVAERVFNGILGTFDTWAIYVGDKLGLYRVMASQKHVTFPELADKTGIDPRYAREWLEQQAVTGLIDCEDASEESDHRRYSLPAGAAEALTDRDSLNFLAPFVRLVTAAGIQLPALLQAYRTGGGVSWSQFGEDMRTGQAEMNRPWFLNALGPQWFGRVPRLREKLEDGARIADIGCGEGWSSIGLAQSFPNVTVDGYDLDVPSIDAAKSHAAAADVDDRVRFRAVDAATVDEEKSYDLVTAFECIHDLSQPVAVLAAMRRLVRPDGDVIVMDERVAEHFPGGDGGDVERLMYGFSLFTCLPDGMSHQPSAATGTVMRPAVLKKYARDAGFSDLEFLPIENDLWRFYRLVL